MWMLIKVSYKWLWPALYHDVRLVLRHLVEIYCLHFDLVGLTSKHTTSTHVNSASAFSNDIIALIPFQLAIKQVPVTRVSLNPAQATTHGAPL